MTSMIERLLARIDACRTAMDAQLDADPAADVGRSAFEDLPQDAPPAALIAAAMADNAARTRARLQHIHTPVAPAPQTATCPTSPRVIDGDCIEINTEEKPSEPS